LVVDITMNIKACRVCGYEEDGYFPYGKDGKCPDYGDFYTEGVKAWRKKWMEAGCKWSDEKFKPKNWNANEQLKNVPPEFF
jgi:hypothetical protein